ncbi:MAG: glycosyltransferase family 4 protein [Deltaproteobacteria bacterium]|nr:glycosyltransferase family 4 protein [Deltaproteobacteria bacterium]MBM4322524.1 glycosyltransferase family 4 protein [Deltaproteobacteria bacterium]
MKKKICMIAYSNFKTDPRIRRESEALTKDGNVVNFLVLAENGMPKTYEMNDVHIIELNMRKHRGQKSASYLLPYLKFLGLAFWHCSRLFLRRQVDIVHVHNMPNFLVLAGLLPRLFGKKVILDIHDSVPETYSSKFGKDSKILYRLLCLEESLCCRFANKLICVNEIQREKLVGRGIPSSKMSILLNVPDPDIFKFQARQENGKKKTFDLVYHGTIDRMLGIDLAIEAVSRMIREIPQIHLHILGEGRNLEEFESLSRALGVEARVHFSKNPLPVEQLPELLRKMDLGVIPNRRNMATELMLPVKLLEYVAMGIPVISSRLKTIEHYFSDNMVTYFEAGNVKSMANAILELYRNERKRQVQVVNAKKFIGKYGWEKHQLELIRLYEDL